MVDRAIIFDALQPQTSDILQTNKTTMVGMGYLLQSLVGNALAVSGFTCTPTNPVSLAVLVGSGSIYFLEATDVTAYGDLPADSTIIAKQGISYLPLTLPITGFTATGGQSQVFLVQVRARDFDDNATVVEYYNPTAVDSPQWGSNRAATQALGTPQNITRKTTCDVALKAGIPATTGSQTTPAADTGWTGLYAITLASGAATVISANIVLLSTAPFFPTLPGIPSAVQLSTWDFANDIGTLNALAATVIPAPSALISGMSVTVKAANTVTGASTFNLNGLGAVAIHRFAGTATSASDILIGAMVELVYDGTYWQITNYNGPNVSTVNNFWKTFPIPFGVADYVIKKRTIKLLVGNIDPDAIDWQRFNKYLTFIVTIADTENLHATFTPISDGVTPPKKITTLVAGQSLLLQVLYQNVDAATLAVNTILPPSPIIEHGQPLQAKNYIPGEVLFLVYDGVAFHKQPRRYPYWFFPQWKAPQTLAVMAIGDQVNVKFDNARAVPLNVNCVGGGVYHVDVYVTDVDSPCCECWHCPNDRVYPNAYIYSPGRLPFPEERPLFFPPEFPGDYLFPFFAPFPELYPSFVGPIVGSYPFPGGYQPLRDLLFFPPLRQLPDRDNWRFQCWHHRCQQDDNDGHFRSDCDNESPFSDICFGKFSLFKQRKGGDPVYGRGPFHIHLTLVTHTKHKACHFHGGIEGGPAHGHSRWDDDDTEWVSLGTFVVGSGHDRDEHKFCPPFGPHLSRISGVAVIRRIA